MKPRRNKPRDAARHCGRSVGRTIDGVKLRAALQRYGRGEMGHQALLDELRSLNVADSPARQLAAAFRPRDAAAPKVSP